LLLLLLLHEEELLLLHLVLFELLVFGDEEGEVGENTGGIVLIVCGGLIDRNTDMVLPVLSVRRGILVLVVHGELWFCGG